MPVTGISAAELERDPYPFLARMRAESPAAFVPALGVWLLTRFDDVKRAHNDPETFATNGPPELSECFGEHHILNVDGEQHARYQSGLHASLSPRTVSDRWVGIIRAIVDRRLDVIAPLGAGDLMETYFEPISVLALAEVLGVPEIGADTLRRWFRALIAGGSNITADRAVADRANAVSDEIDATLAPVFARCFRQPDETMISHMLAHAGGESLAERVHDVTPTLKLAIAGGLQEPSHAASTVTAAILSDSDLRSRFAADPVELIAPVIEEALRWVSPIQQNTRRTQRPVEIGGARIPAGVDVGLSVASANRDERVFGPDADRFRLDRPRSAHLGFGFGDHFCPGSYFGRVVVRHAVLGLFNRLPDIALEGPVSFRGYVFRAPVAVPGRWSPVPA